MPLASLQAQAKGTEKAVTMLRATEGDLLTFVQRLVSADRLW
jgi:hypothetical protein